MSQRASSPRPSPPKEARGKPRQPTGISVSVGLVLITLALAAGSTGCGKEERVDATPALAQSFQSAEPEAKQVIERVNASLRVGNITEATRALEPLVVSRKLTEPQKAAIGVALRQINQAIAANPGLDTKEIP